VAGGCTNMAIFERKWPVPTCHQLLNGSPTSPVLQTVYDWPGLPVNVSWKLPSGKTVALVIWGATGP